MSKSTPKWLEELRADEQRRRDQLPVVKASLVAALRRRRITALTIKYDGEGDSGQIDGITAINRFGRRVALKEDVVRLAPERRPLLLSEAILAFAWHVLDVHHAGFANNDGGFGTIELDTRAGTVTIHHNDRIAQVELTVTEV